MPGGGDFASFFLPGGRSYAPLSCPRSRNLDVKKLVARQSVEGGGGW